MIRSQKIASNRWILLPSQSSITTFCIRRLLLLYCFDILFSVTKRRSLTNEIAS